VRVLLILFDGLLGLKTRQFKICIPLVSAGSFMLGEVFKMLFLCIRVRVISGEGRTYRSSLPEELWENYEDSFVPFCE